MMIKVLHVVTYMGIGGLEVWLMEILRRTDRNVIDYHILVQSDGEGYFDKEIESLGFRVLRCKGRNNPVKFSIEFAKMIKKNGPYDIVHSHVHHFSAFPIMVAKLFGVRKCVAHSHSVNYENRSSLNLLRRMYLVGTELLIKKFSDYGIGVSVPALRDLFGNNAENESDRSVIHCGIDLSRFISDAEKGKRLKESLGIKQGTKIIGHVGRFVESKNHLFILEIVKCLSMIRNDFTLLLVGDGPLLEQVTYQVNDNQDINSKVKFLGERADVPEIMNMLDVFIFPSTREGLGLTLIEAQSAGLPCVISTAIPEEARVIDELINVVSLEENPMKWAELLNNLIEARGGDRSVYMSKLLGSDFNIDISKRAIEGVYSSLAEVAIN